MAGADAQLFRQAGGDRWGGSPDVFAAALARSTGKAFGLRAPSAAEAARYQQSLHLADLALACACAEGRDAAWDYFVAEYRPVLYRAADAVDPGGGAREIADALYGDLFSRSLFRYFHGRSSLATWLRALVAQRYVDRIRETRRLEPLPDDASPAALPGHEAAVNPDRARFAAAMRSALSSAMAALEPRDRLRLRCYYAEEMTLAQIGRVTHEHEATVSRQLARARRTLREEIERRLREEHRFSRAEVAECISSASGDPGTLDLAELLGGRKNPERVRSEYEDAS